MSTPVPTPYDAAASYRNFGQELLRMIQSGQITPERANQLKANVYEATRLGNTAQGQQAMNAAIGAARDALPMKGYDPAAMYRNIGSQLSNAVKSGQMTVQQAQALQAPLFAATKLGNTAPGYAQMNSAYNNAISAIRNASPPQPQGGLTQAAPFDVAAAYRQNAQKLADAVKAGQITVERAQQLQAPLFAATKLGSTPEGQAAMNAAAAQAQGGMPMSGYDAAAQYRNFGQELMGMIKSGALTVEQANALKAPVFNAVKLGNSNAGYQQMQAALNAARQQMGGQNVGQSFNPVTSPPSPPRMPEIVTPPQVSQPQELPVTPTQPDMPERHSEYGIPLWMQLGAGPERDAAYAQYMKAQRGEMQPKGIGGTLGATRMTPPDMPVGPVTPLPYNPVNTTRLEDLRPGSGMGIGAFFGKPGEVPQGVGMPPQLLNMFAPKPPQSSFVDTMPKAIEDPNFRFGQTPQQAPQNAQGMAMGGLLRKYYGGGMC